MITKALHRLLSNSVWLLVLAQLLAFTPLRFVAFLVILWVTARLLPWSLGVFTKLVLAFGLTMSIVIFIAIAAWFMNQPLNAVSVLTLLIVLLGLIMSIVRHYGGQLHNSMHTNLYDIAALVATVAAVTLLLLPALRLPNGSTLVQVSTSGGDNASHLEMIKANDLNQGVVYGSENRVNGISNAINYPKGWHFSVAFVKWLTEPLVTYAHSPTAILAVFYLTAVAWFGILIFLMVRLALRLIEKASPHKHPLALIAAVVVFAAVFMHWLITIFLNGFQAQIAALVFLLLTVFFLVEAFLQKATERWPQLVLATVAAVTINFAWILISPIAFAILAVALLVTLVQSKQWPPAYAIGSMMILGAFAVVQPLFYTLFPVNYGVPALLQDGNAQHTSMYTFLFLFVLLAAYTYFRWSSKAIRIALLFATITLAFSLAIFNYQLSEIEELRYFYFKATSTFIIAATILLAAAAYDCMVLLLRQKTAVSHKLHQTLIVLIVLVVGCMICWQIRHPSVDQYANSKISGIAENQIVDLLKAAAVSNENGYFTVFIGSCNRGDDMRATQLVEALSFSDYQKIPRRVSFAVGHHHEKDIFAMIDNAARWAERPITVISSDLGISERLLASIGDAASNSILINLDTTTQTEPITQCPDRSRNLDLYPLP